MVMPQTARVITPEFIDGMKRGIQQQGSVIESDRTLEVQGLPAVELTGRSAPAAGGAPMIVRCILSDKQSYQLIGMSQNIPDTEIAQIFENFRILNPPNLKTRNAAFEAGRRAGYIFTRVVVPVVLVLGIVAVIVVLALRRKR